MTTRSLMCGSTGVSDSNLKMASSLKPLRSMGNLKASETSLKSRFRQSAATTGKAMEGSISL